MRPEHDPDLDPVRTARDPLPGPARRPCTLPGQVGRCLENYNCTEGRTGRYCAEPALGYYFLAGQVALATGP